MLSPMAGTEDTGAAREGGDLSPATDHNMVGVPNVFDPEWDAETERPPYRWRRSWIGRRAGAEQLGASLFEVAPGASTFPLHAHHANEELVLMLVGTLVLRTPDGERVLEPGDVVACPAGARGAHRLDNRSPETARVLILSTMHAPEINEFPDSGLVWARTSAPGAPEAPAAQIGGEPAAFDPLSLP
jgi:uncharacterized cupin superfamily protein